MISELLTLIGLAFFIKVFFKSAERMIGKGQEGVVSTNNLVIHSVLGLAFILVGRLLVVLL